jgi:glycosyltransferase involved in cell wall biosynthesis
VTASEPFFSVVVPTYNRIKKLQRALRSVVEQTFTDYEVIIVDDRSPDATADFLSTIASDRHRVLRNASNEGAAASRNRGCREAHGQFIVFLDDDDAFRPTALALLRAKYMENPMLDFAWGARLIHENDGTRRLTRTRTDDWSQFIGPIAGAEFLPIVLQIAASAAFSIRRSLFVELGGFDESLKVSEDRDLFIRIARNGNRGGAVSDVIIDIDEHFDGSLSRDTGLSLVPEMDRRVIEKYLDYLQLPENREFLNSYLRARYSGSLRAGDHLSALKTCVVLYRRRALSSDILRMYVRDAREIRLLKRCVLSAVTSVAQAFRRPSAL